MKTTGIAVTGLFGLSGEVVGKVSEPGKVDTSEYVPHIRRWVHTNSEQVAKGAKPKRKPVYGKVARWRWRKAEIARHAAKKIEKKLENDLDKPRGVEVGVTNISNETKAVQVLLKSTRKAPNQRDGDRQLVEPSISKDEVEHNLPSKATGQIQADKNDTLAAVKMDEAHSAKVPVIIEEQTDTEGACQKWKYDTEYGNDIPGGCKITLGEIYAKVGSTCTPAYDNATNERVMLTAGHNIDGSVDDVYQPGGSLNTGGADGIVGEHTKNLTEDFGYIRPPDSRSTPLYKYTLASQGGGYISAGINGSISWSTVTYRQGDQDWTVYKQGVRSGRTEGYIESIRNSSTHKITTTAGMDNGDSGGLMYTLDSLGIGALGVAASFNGGGCPGDVTIGNTIEYVESEYNMTV